MTTYINIQILNKAVIFLINIATFLYNIESRPISLI